MQNNKKNKSFWIAVLILCVMIAGVGLFFLIRSYTAAPAPKREDVISPTSATAQESTEQSYPDTATEAPNKKSFGYKLADPGNLNVDFDKLKAINTDIYAWIYVPNTNIDYPVVRGVMDNSDTFYLNHNVYREYQFSGSVFSELKNHPDMNDPVTVLYGHNMRDGSMFATLHRFEDSDFFRNNTTAFVVTENKIYTYLIYSAYLYDDRHILNSFQPEDEASFQKYLDSTLQPRSYQYQVRDNVALTTKDRILTLSTCADSSGTRYLVQGVLVDEQKK